MQHAPSIIAGGDLGTCHVTAVMAGVHDHRLPRLLLDEVAMAVPAQHQVDRGKRR